MKVIIVEGLPDYRTKFIEDLKEVLDQRSISYSVYVWADSWRDIAEGFSDGVEYVLMNGSMMGWIATAQQGALGEITSFGKKISKKSIYGDVLVHISDDSEPSLGSIRDMIPSKYINIKKSKLEYDKQKVIDSILAEA